MFWKFLRTDLIRISGSLGSISGTAIRVLCIVWVIFHSSGVGIIHCFFFWVPYSMRNVLKKIDIFFQSARPVRKLNQLVRRVSFFWDSMILV